MAVGFTTEMINIFLQHSNVRTIKTIRLIIK
jgi:hypothetical protein